MNNFNKLIIIFLGFLAISCVDIKKPRNSEKYVTVVNDKDNFAYNNPEREKRRTEELLSNDTFYIFFETEFKLDTIEIKIDNEKTKTLYLKTDPSLGLAAMYHCGDIASIDKIEIMKNNGSPLIINLTDKKMNIWTVNFFSDTLIAERRKYLQWYE